MIGVWCKYDQDDHNVHEPDRCPHHVVGRIRRPIVAIGIPVRVPVEAAPEEEFVIEGVETPVEQLLAKLSGDTSLLASGCRLFHLATNRFDDQKQRPERKRHQDDE